MKKLPYHKGLIASLRFLLPLALVAALALGVFFNHHPTNQSSFISSSNPKISDVKGLEYVDASIFLSDVSHLEVDDDFFGATFWLTLAYDENLNFPMNRITFPRSKGVVISNPSEISQDGKRFSFRRVTGNFRHDWDMKQFPFDEQRLEILVALPSTGAKQYVLSPLKINKVLADEITIKGWDVEGTNTEFVSTSSPILISSNDNKENKRIRYSYLKSTLIISRATPALIWKLANGAYAAFLISLSYYFLKAENISTLGARFGILTGSVFATVISMRVSSSEIGAAEYITLIDEIHIGVMLYTMLAIVCAIWTSRLTLIGGNEPQVIRVQKEFLFYSSFAFVGYNLFIFIVALR